MGSCISSSCSIHKNHKVQKMSSSSFDKNSSIPPTPIKDKTLNNNLVNNNVNVDPPFISHSFKSRVSPLNALSSYRSHGSREEAFYDTQGWLDSDCEDDFYSVNGDFTPSRGNTPVHPSIGNPRIIKTFSPQVNKALFDGRLPNSASLHSRGNSSVRRSFSSIPEATGTLPNEVVGTSQDTALKPKKKRLADLFRESMRERGGIGLSFPGYESDTSQKTGTSPNTTTLQSNSRTRNSPLSSGPRNRPENYVLEKDKSMKFSHRCFPKIHVRKP